MLIHTSIGLYCPPGDFYIDPSRVLSAPSSLMHTATMHAVDPRCTMWRDPRSSSTSAARPKNLNAGLRFWRGFPNPGRENFFSSAGHILGSSQIRCEFAGEVWVASGDYKRDRDPTCEPFESVKCDVFITEATFGTPMYCGKKI